MIKYDNKLVSTMNTQQARTLWIQALRSGKYKQGQLVLHNLSNDSYCCLGVACALFAEQLNLTTTHTEYCVKYDRYSSYLPDAVAELLQLRDQYGSSKKNSTSLVLLNDINKYSFDQIADELETGRYWA